MSLPQREAWSLDGLDWHWDVAASGALPGVQVSVLEMAGRAGDVYLMDMRLLHTPSRNAARQPRIMATMRFVAA